MAVFRTCLCGAYYRYSLNRYYWLSIGRRKDFRLLPGDDLVATDMLSALCPVKVKGRENIDRKQSYVFVANHQGAFDIF